MKEPPAITPDTIFQRSERILASNLDTEVVMMDIEAGSYYGLEEPGSRIWELLEMPTSVSDLVDQLAQEYAIDSGQCESEVIAFLEELSSRKIVESSANEN